MPRGPGSVAASARGRAACVVQPGCALASGRVGAWAARGLGLAQDLGGDPAGGAAGSVRGWFHLPRRSERRSWGGDRRAATPLATDGVSGRDDGCATDLIKLGYANCFGDLTLAGVALDRLLGLLLIAGALLPVALLPLVGVPATDRLTLSLPLPAIVQGVRGLAAGVLCAAAGRGGAYRRGLSGRRFRGDLRFSLRALRQKDLGSLLTAAVTARAGSVLVGLLCATRLGITVSAAASCGITGWLCCCWCWPIAPERRRPRRPPDADESFCRGAFDPRCARAARFCPAHAACGRAFPELRAAAIGLAFLSAIVPLSALRLGVAPREPVARRRGRRVRPALPGCLLALTAAAVGSGVLLSRCSPCRAGL